MSIEKLREIIYSNGFHPVYNPEKWNGVLRKTTNCYAYALDALYPETDEVSYLIGEFSGHKYSSFFTDQKLIDHITSDLLALGLEMIPTTLKEDVPEKSYKIAICNSCSDFHFLRRDSSGKWSHKMGWGGRVTTEDYSGREITNPSKADLYDYHIIGYFLIKRKTE